MFTFIATYPVEEGQDIYFETELAYDLETEEKDKDSFETRIHKFYVKNIPTVEKYTQQKVIIPKKITYVVSKNKTILTVNPSYQK